MNEHEPSIRSLNICMHVKQREITLCSTVRKKKRLLCKEVNNLSTHGKHTSDSAFRSSERLVSSICLYHRPFFVSTMACCTIWLHRSFRFSVLNATTIFYQFVLASRVWIIRQHKGFLQALFCIQPKTQARFSKKEVNSYTTVIKKHAEIFYFAF
jgi:hypothetical protein